MLNRFAAVLFLSLLCCQSPCARASQPWPRIEPESLCGTTWEAVLWNEEHQIVVRMEVDSPTSGYLAMGYGTPGASSWVYRITRADVTEAGHVEIQGVSVDMGTIELKGHGNAHGGSGILSLEGEAEHTSLSFQGDNQLVFYASKSGHEVSDLAVAGTLLERNLQDLRHVSTKSLKRR